MKAMFVKAPSVRDVLPLWKEGVRGLGEGKEASPKSTNCQSVWDCQWQGRAFSVLLLYTQPQTHHNLKELLSCLRCLQPVPAIKYRISTLG